MKLIKKTFVLMLALVLLVMPATTGFAATDWLLGQLPDNTLIVGSHAIGIESNDFTVKNVMEAIKTIPSGIDHNNMYYKISGNWFNLTSDSPSEVIANASEVINQDITEYVGMTSPSASDDSVLTKFTMMAPLTKVISDNKVEIPFVALDQNGVRIFDYELLNSKVGLFTYDNLGNNKVYFVKQPDGTAKLFGKFQGGDQNYTTYATVTSYIKMDDYDSSEATQNFVQFEVSPLGFPNAIEALDHPYAYTQGSQWNRRIDKLDIRDQYDRKMNLRTNPEFHDYKVRVMTSDQDVVGVSNPYSSSLPTSTSSSIGVTSRSVEISGNEKVYFTGGNKYGSAVITYSLIGRDKVIDVASTTVYNINPVDITGAEFYPEDSDTILMVKNFPLYYDSENHKVTKIAEYEGGVVFEPTLLGKTNNGTLVRLPDQMIKGYTVDNDKFEVLKVDSYSYIVATGDFGSAQSSETEVTGAIYDVNHNVIETSKVINASAEAPQITDINCFISSMDLYNGVISITDDEITISKYVLDTLNGKSLKYYNSKGEGNLNTGIFEFYADTQYETWTGIIDNISFKKISDYSGCEITVDPTTSIMTFNYLPELGDKWEITVVAGTMTKVYTLTVQ